jgi:phospholipid-translocating ATPase
MLDDNCSKFEGPMGDLNPATRKNTIEQSKNPMQRKGGKRRDQSFIVRDMITCLALCHNVTPTYPDPNDPTIREFQASSPDEVALVKFADSLGI